MERNSDTHTDDNEDSYTAATEKKCSDDIKMKIWEDTLYTMLAHFLMSLRYFLKKKYIRIFVQLY